MAKRECPECYEKIDTRARKCIHCGYDIDTHNIHEAIFSREGFWGCFIFVMFILIFFLYLLS